MTDSVWDEFQESVFGRHAEGNRDRRLGPFMRRTSHRGSLMRLRCDVSGREIKTTPLSLTNILLQDTCQPFTFEVHDRVVH